MSLLNDYLEMLTQEGRKKLQETRNRVDKKFEPVLEPKAPPKDANIPQWIYNYLQREHEDQYKEFNGNVMDLMHSWDGIIVHNKLKKGSIHRIVLCKDNYYSAGGFDVIHQDMVAWMVCNNIIKSKDENLFMWFKNSTINGFLCLEQLSANTTNLKFAESYTPKTKNELIHQLAYKENPLYQTINKFEFVVERYNA